MPRLTRDQVLARRDGLGSSDVPELLGLSPYQGAGPIRLFAEKCGLLPLEEDEEEADALELGHLLEEPLVRFYERKTGHVADLGFETVIHPEHAWRRASLDARVRGRSCALEVKAVGIGMHRAWDPLSDDGIPNYVRAQCAWQMHVANLEEVHVVAMIGGPSGFRVFYVPRDRELEELVVAEAAAFWTRVLERRAPDLDGSEAAREYLERKFPSPPEPVVVEAPEDMIAIGSERARFAIAEKNAAEGKARSDALIMARMGELGATVMHCPAWRASWGQAKREGGKRRFVFTAKRIELEGGALEAGELSAGPPAAFAGGALEAFDDAF